MKKTYKIDVDCANKELAFMVAAMHFMMCVFPRAVTPDENIDASTKVQCVVIETSKTVQMQIVDHLIDLSNFRTYFKK